MLSPRHTLTKDYIRAGFFLALGVVLLCVLAFALRRFLEATLTVAAPFVVGLMLALLLDPIADRLMQMRLSRLAAVSVVFGGLILLLVLLGAVLAPALVSQARDLKTNGPQFISGIKTYTDHFLAAHPHIGPLKMPKTFAQLSSELSARASTYVSQASSHISDYLIGSATLLIQIVLTLIITFFLLADIDRLRARLFYLAPEHWRPTMHHLGGDIGGVFSDYLRGLLVVCTLYSVVTISLLYGLSIVHHPLAHYALLVGAMAGVLYAIPYLGSATTALVTFLVAFAAASSPHHSGLAFGGLAVLLSVVVNQVFDNIVTPRVVGGGVGLHPVLALFALVIGGTLFNIWGMLLSVPIAGSIQVILFRQFPKLTTPTPLAFLRVQGVPLDQKESAKILEGEDSVTTERQEAEQH